MHTKSAAICALLATLSVSPLAIANPTVQSVPQQKTETATPNQGPTAPLDRTTDRANAPSAPKTASSEDRANYAAREAASPDAKNYKGGDDVVIISASTTAVILGVVLLVILL